MRIAIVTIGLLWSTASAGSEQTSLLLMEQKWRDSGITSYTFRPFAGCWVQRSIPVRVDVRDGRVRTVTLTARYRTYEGRTLPRGARIKPDRFRGRPDYLPPLTVDELFAVVRAEVPRYSVAAEITSHSTLGYPISVYFDDPDVDDDECVYGVKELRPRRRMPATTPTRPSGP